MDTLTSRLLLAVFAVANVADVLSTRAVLATGGRELNPLMALLFAHGVLFALGYKALLVAVVGVGCAHLPRQLSEWLLVVLCAVVVVVVFSNLTQVR